MPTLESQLASAADEIAYNTADLDDGLRAGLLDPYDLNELDFWREWRALAKPRDERFDDMVRHKFIRWLVNEFVTDFVNNTDAQLGKHTIESVEQVRAFGGALAEFSAAFEERKRPLQDFLMSRFYRQYRVMRMASKAEQVIEKLFHAYLADPRLLPTKTQARLENDIPARVVCDYVAGMTDRYALDEYARLFDPMTRV
jgi:dGTPase